MEELDSEEETFTVEEVRKVRKYSINNTLFVFYLKTYTCIIF